MSMTGGYVTEKSDILGPGHIAGQEEGEFTKNVNARLDQFLEDLRDIKDSGPGNVGNVDREKLTIKFVEDINLLRK